MIRRCRATFLVLATLLALILAGCASPQTTSEPSLSMSVTSALGETDNRTDCLFEPRAFPTTCHLIDVKIMNTNAGEIKRVKEDWSALTTRGLWLPCVQAVGDSTLPEGSAESYSLSFDGRDHSDRIEQVFYHPRADLNVSATVTEYRRMSWSDEPPALVPTPETPPPEPGAPTITYTVVFENKATAVSGVSVNVYGYQVYKSPNPTYAEIRLNASAGETVQDSAILQGDRFDFRTSIVKPDGSGGGQIFGSVIADKDAEKVTVTYTTDTGVNIRVRVEGGHFES